MTAEAMTVVVESTESVEQPAPDAAPREEPRSVETRAEVTRVPTVEAPVGRLAQLLASDGSWRQAGMRTGVGLAMSAAFGLALGARQGGGAMLVHAVGIAAAPLAVLAFGVPALYIVLALFDAPVDALGMARCAGRGVAALGIVLAGLAPITALYAVSAENVAWAAVAGFLALAIGGLVGLGAFRRALREASQAASVETRSALAVSTLVFGAIATVAAGRIWLSLVPSFGGGL